MSPGWQLEAEKYDAWIHKRKMDCMQMGQCEYAPLYIQTHTHIHHLKICEYQFRKDLINIGLNITIIQNWHDDDDDWCFTATFVHMAG